MPGIQVYAMNLNNVKILSLSHAKHKVNIRNDIQQCPYWLNRRGSRNFRQGGGGGSNHMKNFEKQKKKTKKKQKKKTKREEGWRLQYLFCFSMVEIYFCHWNSFINNIFYKYDISWCFLQAKHIKGDCLSFVKCVILQGGPPPEKK